MLEQQQSQLVSGLQELYKRLRTSHGWEGAALDESNNGHPLTHDILAALNLLEAKKQQDGNSHETEAFEEDVLKLQARLLAEGAGYAHRRSSMSSDSDHSLHGQGHLSTLGQHARSGSRGTPIMSPGSSFFPDNFHLGSAPGSPQPGRRLPHSPVAGSMPSRNSFAATSHPGQLSTQLSNSMSHPSPLTNDPQFYQAEWAYPDMSSSAANANAAAMAATTTSMVAEKMMMMRARYANMSTGGDMEPNLSLAGGMAELEQRPHRSSQQHSPWTMSPTATSMAGYDMSNPVVTSAAWPAQQLVSAAFAQQGLAASSSDLDSMDIDLNQYIQVVT